MLQRLDAQWGARSGMPMDSLVGDKVKLMLKVSRLLYWTRRMFR